MSVVTENQINSPLEIVPIKRDKAFKVTMELPITKPHLFTQWSRMDSHIVYHFILH